MESGQGAYQRVSIEPAASGITTIIFDLGKVVLDFNHMIAAQRLARHTAVTGEQIYDLFFDSELTGLFEEGKIRPEEFFDAVRKKLDLKISFAEFRPIWNEIFFFNEQNRQVYALARSLKERYTVVLLSNVNQLHFEYIKETFPVCDAFHIAFTSYELGVRKPDPRIYHKVLTALGSSASACFYTDDRPELIDSARTLGIKGYVYTGVLALRESLVSEGVMV